MTHGIALAQHTLSKKWYFSTLADENVLEELYHTLGVWNPMDAGTKTMSFESQTMSRLRELSAGWYKPMFG